jgi:hypothetical protein
MGVLHRVFLALKKSIIKTKGGGEEELTKDEKSKGINLP